MRTLNIRNDVLSGQITQITDRVQLLFVVNSSLIADSHTMIMKTRNYAFPQATKSQRVQDGVLI